MASKSAVDQAIESLDSQIAALQAAREALIAVTRTTVKRTPRKTPTTHKDPS